MIRREAGGPLSPVPPPRPCVEEPRATGPVRLGWDEYFLGVAEAVKARGDCTRDQVGAVIVDQNHRIISTGYNGSPPGAQGCLAGACPRGRLSLAELPSGTPGYATCYAIHAEKNAIMYADWRLLPGSTIYVTRNPCSDCAAIILESGLTEVHA